MNKKLRYLRKKVVQSLSFKKNIIDRNDRFIAIA